MGKARLEAFSDGVFAIAITLLVLEIHIPAIRGANTPRVQFEGLLHQWPAYVVYAATFATIGIMWMNHNRLFAAITRVTHETMVANLALLAAVCFLPFLTDALSAYGISPVTSAAYALGFVPISLAFTWLRSAVHRAEGIPVVLDAWNIVGLTIYPVAAAVGYFFPYAGIALIAGIAVFYLLPKEFRTAPAEHSDPREEAL